MEADVADKVTATGSCVRFTGEVMETEYTGHRLLALLQEVRQRGWWGSTWRAGYELRKRLGRVASHFRTEPLSVEELCGLFDPPLSGAAALRRLVHDRMSRTFLISPEARDAFARSVRERCPDSVDRVVAAADEICRGRFEFMGKTFDFRGEPIDWHLDPESGRRWPRESWSRFSIYGPDAPGDVKFAWELNRHQFWPTLGRAYWLTGDERYAEAWVAQVAGWLDENPPELGVNWGSNLEHALRIANWWIALAMFMPAPQLSDELLARIVGTMVLKARHIVADLDYSRISMANNHLLGDAMGLAVMALALPELPETERWRDLGLDILWTEAPRQIHPDGSSFECAISYHRFVAYFYLLVLRLCDRSGVPVPDEVRQRLEGMFEFVLHLRRPDGDMPSIGDWDDGRTVVLSEQALGDFAPMLSTGAVMFSRGDMAWAAGEIDEETLWWLGPKAAEDFDALRPAPPAETSRAFPDGGYFISRSDWTAQAHYAVVRNGPFDSHTHADLLNVEISAFGQPLLVDPGTYTYNGPWAWRTYFRSARAHNGLMVDGQGQTCAHRIFRWLFPPTGTTLAWHSSRHVDYYEGEHDGYRRLPGRPVHRRIVVAVRGQYWMVLDGLLGQGSHDVELPLHAHPSMTLASQTPHLRLVGPNDVGVVIATWSLTPLGVQAARGEEDPIDGWYSPGYGRRSPATTVHLTTWGDLPIWIAWLVVPYRGRVPNVALHPPEDSGVGAGGVPITRVGLRIDLDDVTDTFIYRPAAEPVRSLIAPGLELPVGAAWARLDSESGRAVDSWSRP